MYRERERDVYECETCCPRIRQTSHATFRSMTETIILLRRQSPFSSSNALVDAADPYAHTTRRREHFSVIYPTLPTLHSILYTLYYIA